MITLPAHATAASRQRAQIAERLVDACPPDLADGIALTGSTARGVADDHSDLELNLWAGRSRRWIARVAWLTAAGATDLQVEDAPRPDDSYWIKFRLGDLSAEVGWQTLAALHAQIEHIRSGATLERKIAAFGDVIANAIPLRGDQVKEEQIILSGYSDAVQRGIVQLAVDQWSQPKRWATARRLAQHGERLTLSRQLLDDLDLALRLLYAINRRWEPSAKWTLTVAREFAPADLITRIDDVLSYPSLTHRVDPARKSAAICWRWCPSNTTSQPR